MAGKNNITGKNPSKIPENYFEDLTGTVLKKAGIITIIRPHLTLAAAMIAFAVISYLAIEFLIPQEDSEQIEIEYSELTEYLNDEINIPVQDIIDYLIETNIDYTEILENL